jgi:hypothetical protein
MAGDLISFATFNLHNLQEVGHRVYGGPPLGESQVRRQVSWIAGMLRQLRADFVGVQELWHPAPLQRALEEAGLAESHVVIFPPDAEPGAGIVCGAVARRDLVAAGEAEWIADFPPACVLRTEGRRKGTDPETGRSACPTPDASPDEPPFEVSLSAFSRPVLRVPVGTGEGRPDAVALVCHLKSRNPTTIECDGWFGEDAPLFAPHRDALGAALSTVRRTAEAAALRVILTGIMRGNRTPVVLMGDINDGLDTSTVAILTEQPRLSDASRGPTDEGSALYPVQAIEEARSLRDVFYTYIFRGAHASLDNILVSQEFYDFSRTQLWVMDDLRIFNDHLSRSGPTFGAAESDHGVVVARFRWTGDDPPQA